MDKPNVSTVAEFVRVGLHNLRHTNDQRTNRAMAGICFGVLRELTGLPMNHTRGPAYHYLLMNPDQRFADKLEAAGVRLRSKLDGEFFQFDVELATEGIGYTIRLPYDAEVAALVNLGNRTIH